MSAPSATTPSGAINGAPPPRKQPPKTNIFNTRKVRRPMPSAGQRPGPPPTAAAPARPSPPTAQQSAATQKKDPEEGTYTDYPIIIKKHFGDAGKRFHAFKLQSRTDADGQPLKVDPYDPNQFERPLRLFRRYGTDKMETADQDEAASGVDDKEREMALAKQAERQAEKEENKKLIAPTGGEASRPGKKKPQKKVEEGRDDSDPVRQKRRQLRYEEAKRWHLEDKNGKNIWVGNYEEALSENSVLLTIGDGDFRVVPVERWYKFIQTNKFDMMTSDEIEKYLSKKAQPSRWALKTQPKLEVLLSQYDEETQKELKKEILRRKRENIFNTTQRIKNEQRSEYQNDRDLLDMEFNDEFQDDDEGALFQGDEGEDAKDIEKKLWEEMRNAGLGGTGVKNEELDPEEEERKRALEEAEERKKSKRIRRQLQKREHKGEYESDSEGNRYETSSDSEDSDEERNKDEEAKKEEARKLANGDKSGASSRGNNTPSGRPEKRANPDTSDASGNESSRKRAKGLNGNAVSTSNGQGGARSLSPDAARLKKIRAPRSTAGSGSGSDTDTSRVGRSKLKQKKDGQVSPSANTPSGSRAGSPSATGSRAQSPKAAGGAADNFPTLAEVSAAIPPEGIKIPMLVQLFKSRVKARGAEFISLVKSAGVQDKSQQGVIRPKTG